MKKNKKKQRLPPMSAEGPTFVFEGEARPFVLPDIREAIGLDSDEKAFLYDIASHIDFEESGSEDRILQRVGFGRDVFERVRTSLARLGLITITHRSGFTNLYRLEVDALKRFPKAWMARPSSNTPPKVLGPQGVAQMGRTPAGHPPRKLNIAEGYARSWPGNGLSEDDRARLDEWATSSWRVQTRWLENDEVADDGDEKMG